MKIQIHRLKINKVNDHQIHCGTPITLTLVPAVVDIDFLLGLIIDVTFRYAPLSAEIEFHDETIAFQDGKRDSRTGVMYASYGGADVQTILALTVD